MNIREARNVITEAHFCWYQHIIYYHPFNLCNAADFKTASSGRVKLMSIYDQNRWVSREEKSGFTGQKTPSSGRMVLYAGLVLLGLVVLVAGTSWGTLVKVFVATIIAPFILLALGFIWIVVKVFMKVIYFKVRRGILAYHGPKAKGL
jgi:hypothetical protein